MTLRDLDLDSSKILENSTFKFLHDRNQRNLPYSHEKNFSSSCSIFLKNKISEYHIKITFTTINPIFLQDRAIFFIDLARI